MDWVLVLAIVLGLRPVVLPTTAGAELGWIGLQWFLAGVWVLLRRREILGAHPWLPLWLVLPAIQTGDRSEAAPGLEWLEWTPLVVLGAVTIYGLLTSPRAFLGALLTAVACLLCLIGGMMVLFALGRLVMGDEGGEYTILSHTMPADRTGHVYAALWGLGMAAFGVFGLWLRCRRWWNADRP